MNDFDKLRIENAIWTLLQYKYERIGMVEDMEDEENWFSGDMKTALSLLEDIEYQVLRKH